MRLRAAPHSISGSEPRSTCRPGTQKIEDIEAELAGAQTTLAAATDRHQQTKSTLADMLQQIEGVSNEDVAAKIMALQTRLQASLADDVAALQDEPGQLH